MAGTLIVYYSRTGYTRTVCEHLARRLGADAEEIIDQTDRRGAMGYLRAGKDATLKRLTPIGPVTCDPAEYDLVVLATPVWAFTLTPAIRTYIDEQGQAIRRAAFIATQNASGDQRTFRDLSELLGLDPVATLTLLTRDIKIKQIDPQIETFAAELEQAQAGS
jgi:menaquinone-dependent protoporphyrinogen IX oxidase